MRKRLLITIILWAIIAATLVWGGAPAGKALLLIFATATTWELAALLRKTGLGVLVPVCALATAIALGGHLFGFASVGTSIGLLLILAAHFNAPIATMPAALLAALIPSIGLGSLHAISAIPHPYSLLWVVWIVAVIKCADANAYLVGRYLGRHKLAPTISPGKTWEGFAGALIAGCIFGLYGGVMFDNLWFGPILGIILGAIGSIGDILESALKRRAQVKDSGHFLPGLGGALDLADSLILAAPVAWLALKICV